MKGKKVLSLLVASALLLSAAAGCNSNNNNNSGTTGTNTNPGSTTNAGSGDAASTSGTDRDYYEFTVYCNYDWWEVKPWGGDEASKWWKEKFNIHATYTKPDSNADEKLNLMISSGDLPDAIIMDRGAQNIRLAQLGMLVDLDTLKPKVDNNWYDEAIAKSTQEILKIDGKLYSIPNWPRNAPTGGNEMWLYTQEIYEAAGSPTIRTFEDLYSYAINVRDNVKQTSTGMDVIPFATDASGDGTQTVRAIYRSMGSPTLAAGTFYGRVGEQYQFVLRDPAYRQAALEANKWFREGLLSQTTFTNSGAQWLEQLTNARVGLMWYDMSTDDGNNFRKIVRETFPGNSIEYITFEDNGTTYAFPPANGLSPSQIHSDHDSSVGWNVNCITTTAKKPERIFELYTHMLTAEGAINMMYGPQGELWDELDAKGNPILKQSPDNLPAEEVNRLGLWVWPQPAHSNIVDNIKFDANDALPEDQRSWVTSTQAHILTPLKGSLSDEYTQIDWVIEPNTDLAVKRTLIQDYIQTQLPRIIMAASAAEAETLYDEAIAWAEANGLKEIEAVYDVKYQENCALQGGSVYTDGHKH